MQLFRFGRIDWSRQLDGFAVEDPPFDWAHRPLSFGRRLTRLRLDGFRIGFSYFRNRHLAAPNLKVRVLDLHADPQVSAVFKNQVVVCVCIGRKPVLAIDLLAIGFDDGKLIVLGFRDSFAFRLNDLQITIVNPDATDKESLFSILGVWRSLWRHVKHVEIQFIDSLFANVFEIVLIDFCTF